MNPAILSGEIILRKTIDELNTRSTSNVFTVVDNTLWSVEAYMKNDYLCVYLVSKSIANDTDMNIVYEVLGNTTITKKTATHIFFASSKDYLFGFEDFVSWTRLAKDYVVHGLVTIRVRFSKIMPQKKLNFDRILYPDLTIVCEGVEFKVNMGVVAVKSEVHIYFTGFYTI